MTLSIELCIVLFMAAAFAVALCARPHGTGPAETTFATGTLTDSHGNAAPAVEFDCLDNGNVMITRRGLQALTTGATVALAVTRTGFDINIEERITLARPDTAAAHTPADTATFMLEGLANERYHIKYNSEATSSFAALTVRNIPGLHAARPLG